MILEIKKSKDKKFLNELKKVGIDLFPCRKEKKNTIEYDLNKKKYLDLDTMADIVLISKKL